MKMLSKLNRRGDPLPPLDLTHPFVVELSEELQALHALPISSKEQIAHWEAEAAKFRKKLRGEWTSVYDSLPHELEHYLDDVDIRSKDSGYMKYQTDLLSTLLSLR